MKFYNISVEFKLKSAYGLKVPQINTSRPTAKQNSQKIISNVLNCNGIDNAIKKKLICKCEKVIAIMGYEEVYKKCIIEEEITVPYNILKQFATATAIRSKEKVKILIVCLEDIENKLQQSQVKDYLGAFDKSYLEIFNSDYDINKEEDSLRRELYQILNRKKLLQVA